MDFTSTRRTFALKLGSSSLGPRPYCGCGHARNGAELSGCERHTEAERGRQAGQRKRRHHARHCSQRIDLCFRDRRARFTRDQKEWTIESHTSIVMDKLKKMVEIGGGTMDTVLQANVFLVKIEHWDGMHKTFATYFPHGGPARTTVAVAALPGDSLVEINCIAAVAHK